MISRWAACVLALLATACGDRSPATRREGASITPAADTVVRRVVRYRQEPSALQRVTGALGPARAGRMLDSTLAIRVLDARGNPVPGVALEWRIANAGAGASLSVLAQRSDSDGVSRARFTPGTSAATQRVAAEIPGIGRIDFAVTVPVAAVRVDAANALWSGESAVATATLLDSSGTRLSDGTLTWATTDSSVLVVQRSDSQRVGLTGRVAGSAELWAWSGRARGTSRIRVRPVLNATVTSLAGSPVPARLTLHPPPDPDGAMSGDVLRARIPWEAGSELVVRATPVDTARFHDARIRVVDPRQLHDLRIVLIPRRWTIGDGSYAGRTLDIDAALAMTPVNGRAPFWRLAPVSGRGPKTILGWHEASFPIRVAFNRERSAAPITAADSARFWAIARQMERDLGATLFRPAMIGDPGAVGVEVRSSESEGHTFVSWTQTGDANDGTLLFRAAETLGNAHVVTHELLHLLGFGHSVSWPTVSRPVANQEQRLTPQDVAYVQLGMALRRSGGRIGFPRLP